MKFNIINIAGIKLMGLTLFLIGLFGVLGSLSLTSIGIKVYSIFIRGLGDGAWAGPIICIVLSIFGWLGSSQPLIQIKRSTRRRNKSDSQLVKKGKNYSKENVNKKSIASPRIPLPSTKLVSLKGFNEYFAADDLQIEATATREDLNEIGNDFSTYFTEGELQFKVSSKRLEKLNGFRVYFESHQAENNSNFISEGENNLPTNHTINLPPNVNKSIKVISETKAELIKEQPIDKELLTNSSDKVIDESSIQDSRTESSSLSNYPGQVSKLVECKASLTEKWKQPNIHLLNPYEKSTIENCEEDSAQLLEEVLSSFGISGKVTGITKGPVITRYELVPAPGIKISRIVGLADDLSLALAAKEIRIEAPIPGKAAIGIEVPNQNIKEVTFHELIDSKDLIENRSLLKIALGKDISGEPVIADLVKMPHLLVAGATGSGKSVCINTLINSLLFNANPDQVKLILIDPKKVELNMYNGIPHLIMPVVTDSRLAASALKWAVKEMEVRYELFAAQGVRDIATYNNQIVKVAKSSGVETLPKIIIIIDELADLMMVAPADVEEAICRLAQMARAAGIHLVIATQRPSVNVITGIIKANIPSRISFAVTSQIDSRTILDATGAEKLLGKGDMLFSPIGLNKPLRVQGCYITDEEISRVVHHWKSQGEPEYLDTEQLREVQINNAQQDYVADELFVEAAELVITSGIASVSFLQRKLKIGYARAARLIDILEEKGIVGGYEGSKPRQVLINIEQFHESSL